MKRLLAILLCLLLALPVFTGCHGSRGLDPFVPPAEFDAERSYEISFWAKNDTNKTQTAIYQKAIADFEALYPNIKVNLRLYTNYGNIYNDVIETSPYNAKGQYYNMFAHMDIQLQNDLTEKAVVLYLD